MQQVSRAFLTLLAAAWIAGCQQAAPKPAAAPQAAPAPQSQLDAFVTTAQPGEALVIDDPQLGQARVTVLKEYPAASGEYCRRFSVELASHPGQTKLGVTCYNGVNWAPVTLEP
jgi:hypothetical protein